MGSMLIDELNEKNESNEIRLANSKYEYIVVNDKDEKPKSKLKCFRTKK